MRVNGEERQETYGGISRSFVEKASTDESLRDRQRRSIVPILCHRALYRPDLSWHKATGVKREVLENKPVMVGFPYLLTTRL